MLANWCSPVFGNPRLMVSQAITRVIFQYKVILSVFDCIILKIFLVLKSKLTTMNPISYLQEYCQKSNSSFPIYDTIDHKILPTMNIFTIRVTIASLTAEGTAPNKKAAKFKAAENMISLLNSKSGINFTPSSNSSPVCCSLKKIFPDSSKNSPNTSLNSESLNNSLSMIDGNFVGKLQDFCVQHNLKIPIYDWDLSYIGSGHKLICKLGDWSEEAAAQNKKIAKQACAEKMWQRLMRTGHLKDVKQESNVINENVEDSLSFALNKLKIENSIDLQSSIEKAQLLYSQQQTGEVNDPKHILIKDYHSYLKNSLTPDTFQKVNKYLDGLTLNVRNGVQMLENSLKKICSILDVGFKEMSLQSSTPNKFIVAYTVNTIPSCTAIGIGNYYEVAKINAIIYCINTIREIIQ